MRRRFYEYALVLSLIAVAVVTAAALTNTPPERAPLQYSDVFYSTHTPPDRSQPLPAKIEDRCLILADGREFDCMDDTQSPP